MSKIIKLKHKSQLQRRNEEILRVYNYLDDNDVSTERLLAMVCDECDCDVTEVVDALLYENVGIKDESFSFKENQK